MTLSRRDFVAAASATSLSGLLGFGEAEASQETRKRTRLGIGSSSYSLRNRVQRRKNGSFTDPLTFLNYCNLHDKNLHGRMMKLRLGRLIVFDDICTELGCHGHPGNARSA